MSNHLYTILSSLTALLLVITFLGVWLYHPPGRAGIGWISGECPKAGSDGIPGGCPKAGSHALA